MAPAPNSQSLASKWSFRRRSSRRPSLGRGEIPLDGNLYIPLPVNCSGSKHPSVKLFVLRLDLEHLYLLQSPYQTQNRLFLRKLRNPAAKNHQKPEMPPSNLRFSEELHPLNPPPKNPGQLTPLIRSPIIAVSRLSSRARDPLLHFSMMRQSKRTTPSGAPTGGVRCGNLSLRRFAPGITQRVTQLKSPVSGSL